MCGPAQDSDLRYCSVSHLGWDIAGLNDNIQYPYAQQKVIYQIHAHGRISEETLPPVAD